MLTLPFSTCANTLDMDSEHDDVRTNKDTSIDGCASHYNARPNQLRKADTLVAQELRRALCASHVNCEHLHTAKACRCLGDRADGLTRGQLAPASMNAQISNVHVKSPTDVGAMAC